MATTISELISSIEVELEAVQKRRMRAKAEVQLILDEAKKEGRANLTDQETEHTDALFETIRMSKAQEKGIRDKLSRAEAIKREEDETEKAQREVYDTPTAGGSGVSLAPRSSKPHYDQAMRVGNEPHTYNPDSDPAGRTFLMDVARNFLYQDPQASYRLSRHMQEAKVDGVMSERLVAGAPLAAEFGGLVVPQYLIELTAPAVQNMRPFADVCTKHVLPSSGLTFTIPVFTGPTTVTVPATEVTAASATTPVEADKTVYVKIASGQQTLSRASIDRGTGIEDIVLTDLIKAYNTQLDNTLLNGATYGLTTVAHTVTYTDAAPTGAALYPYILGAASQSESGLADRR